MSTRLTGNLDAAGVRAELARADVFIGPTRGDNFFVSAAEANTYSEQACRRLRRRE